MSTKTEKELKRAAYLKALRDKERKEVAQRKGLRRALSSAPLICYPFMPGLWDRKPRKPDGLWRGEVIRIDGKRFVRLAYLYAPSQEALNELKTDLARILWSGLQKD